MTSVQSSLDADADEVDLSGLVESIVDSDEEEDLAESMDVRIVSFFTFNPMFCTPKYDVFTVFESIHFGAGLNLLRLCFKLIVTLIYSSIRFRA